MFSAPLSRRLRSFAFYLGLGYLVVYAVGTCCLYFLSSRVITKSTRKFDRQDVRAECDEFLELMSQNADGNWLAEEVSLERYPPSTIFVVRVLNVRGEVEFATTRPLDVDLPHWGRPQHAVPPLQPAEGWQECYLPTLRRTIQILTVRLEDGRTLQLGKGSFLEFDQKSMLTRNLLLVIGISTLLSLISGVVMMLLTLRPIHRIAASMSQIIQTGAFEKGAPPVTSTIAELDTLGRLFTVMTEKYANLIKAMRQTMDNIAHDFRTPLARIRGASELALHNPNVPPDLAETLADIIEDCDRVQLQLQNLMDSREMESGFVRLNIRPFSLKQVIVEIVDLYLLFAEEKQVELTAELPEDGLVIPGDRLRVVRAFANLVDNAIKYTPRGGSVRISFEDRPDAVVTCVSDTGIGIPEEEQSLVWQRLFRGRQARESEKGLGLGLNIVQVIVNAHGGAISLTSGAGQGSVFRVTLPKNRPDAV